MDNQKSWEMDDSSPVDSLLSKRMELDMKLEELRQEVTVLFSDIVHYTDYVSQHGDVAGRMLQERHLRILLPRVTRYGGVLVKSIGDALMVRFNRPSPAVEAACCILRAIQEDNRDLAEDSQLHLRIGIASGRALIEANDVNGEVVNLSARLCKIAGVDSIMVSQQTLQGLDHYLSTLCVPREPALLRGIPMDTVRAFQVVWDTETPVRPVETSMETIILELSLEGDRLKQSLSLGGASRETVTHYEHLPWQGILVEKTCAQIQQTLKRANTVRARKSLESLAASGASLYDVLFTSRVKEYLAQTSCEYLVLKIQDSLVSIPWELLHDGNEFLSIRFAMGRLVESRRPPRFQERSWKIRPRISIISDPGGNLPSSGLEGRELVHHLGASERIQVALKSGATVEYVRRALRESEVVHFCGHADYDDQDLHRSGWRLVNGTLTGGDVLQMAESDHPLPLMVFANACQSGRSEEWAQSAQNHIYGLASGFLHAGVPHYIGTFWDVLDQSSCQFAIRFYEALSRGNPIGWALREARRDLLKAADEGSLIWASYMLYGDPSSGIFGIPDLALTDEAEEPVQETFQSEKEYAGATTESMQVGQDITRAAKPSNPLPSSSHTRWAIWGGVALIAALLFIFLIGQNQIRRQEPGIVQPVPPTGAWTLLDELNQRYSDLEYQSRLLAEDTWTSRRMTIGVMPLKLRGSVEAESPEVQRAYNTLVQGFVNAPGIQVVERERLDAALKELQLGTSPLADPELFARLGQLLFSRLFLTAVLMGEGEHRYLSYHLFDCETSAVVAPDVLEGSEAVVLASEATDRIIRRIQQNYPLRGKIIESNDEVVYLNIGSTVGVTRGQRYRVLTEPDVPAAVRGLIREIGVIEIEETADSVAVARMIQQDIPLEASFKVERLLNEEDERP